MQRTHRNYKTLLMKEKDFLCFGFVENFGIICRMFYCLQFTIECYTNSGYRFSHEAESCRLRVFYLHRYEFRMGQNHSKIQAQIVQETLRIIPIGSWNPFFDRKGVQSELVSLFEPTKKSPPD